jgi:hypothetical protein
MKKIEAEYLKELSLPEFVELAMGLADELNATTARVHLLEIALERAGVLVPGTVESLRPTEEEAVRLGKVRDLFLYQLVRIMTQQGPDEYPLRAEWLARLGRGV